MGEWGGHSFIWVINYLKLLEFVSTAVLTKLRMKCISYFIVTDTIILDNKSQMASSRNIQNLIPLLNTEKTIFLFNNADTFICKKLGYFTYEALQIRELCDPRT